MLRRGNKRKKESRPRRNPASAPVDRKLVLRRVAMGLILVTLGWSAGAGWEFLCQSPHFSLSTVIVTGNKRLGEQDIRQHLGLGRDNLLTLDLKSLEGRLMESPWIRSLRLRKDLPDQLLVEIEENTPLALMEKGERFALLDQDGREIELLPPGLLPFLPVVRGNPDGGALDPETLALLRALRETGVADGREMVEVQSNTSFGVVLTIDGLATRMGNGDFQGKLQRWAAVEGGIRNSGMRVDYVDVRFDDRVVVREIEGGRKNG